MVFQLRSTNKVFDKLIGQGHNSLSVLKDPFIKDKIECIDATYEKRLFSGQWYARGYISFKNGSTEGKQRFEAETWEELMKQMHDFMITLKS